MKIKVDEMPTAPETCLFSRLNCERGYMCTLRYGGPCKSVDNCKILEPDRAPETNFERFKKDLTQDKFIDLMILNCDECPTQDTCRYYGNTVTGCECAEVLESWCGRRV